MPTPIEREELNRLFDEVKRTQTAFWDALRRLEQATGVEIECSHNIDFSEYDSVPELLDTLT